MKYAERSELARASETKGRRRKERKKEEEENGMQIGDTCDEMSATWSIALC